MSLNRSIGSEEYLRRRIPKNAKYDHVKTRLDTGCSTTKYMEKLEELRKNYRYRKDEIFKRLKVTTFAQLILQVALLSDKSQSEVDDESHIPQDSLSVVSDADLECSSEYTNGSPLTVPLSHRQNAGDSKDICHSARSTLLSVISGVGELNLDEVSQQMGSELVSNPADNTPYPDCPYLLLDVRDHEQYDHCHIVSAHSFPVAMLSRTMNPYTKEMLEYKNAQGKIIIVYDEDEIIASQAATTMCQRGFENLFMLSGGLKVIAQKFPSGMTTGSFPASCMPFSNSKGRKCSVPQQPAQTAERRWRFTLDELEKIQEQLEETLIPSKSNSRASSCLTPSSARSSASSRLSSSSAGRNSSRVQSSRPWK
ncbi:centrosomal protein of 41 kDa [Kryptolebias marmoratus]|uniref:Centrosomal protein 41 n=1 Tax=Kryptolebias marmoratus TaxID=37003 RepID=A0A3Q3AJG9_KRYMA|nr:centrosomal protein of 41 kDa [Kryptolebias marmoratus]